MGIKISFLGNDQWDKEECEILSGLHCISEHNYHLHNHNTNNKNDLNHNWSRKESHGDGNERITNEYNNIDLIISHAAQMDSEEVNTNGKSVVGN